MKEEWGYKSVYDQKYKFERCLGRDDEDVCEEVDYNNVIIRCLYYIRKFEYFCMNSKELLSDFYFLQDKKVVRVNQVMCLKLDRGFLRLLILFLFVFLFKVDVYLQVNNRKER